MGLDLARVLGREYRRRRVRYCPPARRHAQLPRRRHTLNPVKIKAQAAKLDEPAPRGIFRRHLALDRRLTVALLNLLTVVLLSVSFAPFDCWWFAYVALVPWTVALAAGRHRRWEAVCAIGAGTLFWLVNLWWLTWVTLVGYFALVFYLSLYWLAGMWLVRGAMRRNWPMWVALPVLWVALEYARVHAISGFPWFFLAHSQYQQTRLIQIADAAGQYGVSFFVAMVNGAVVDVLARRLFTGASGGAKERSRSVFAGLRRGKSVVAISACAVCLAGMLGYGSWRLVQETQSPGPVFGVVQRAHPVSFLWDRGATAEEVFDDYLAGAKELADAGADVVVIPETMLPKGLNPELLSVDVDSLEGTELRSLAGMFFGPAVLSEPDERIRAFLRLLLDGLGGIDFGNLEGERLRALAALFFKEEEVKVESDQSLRRGLRRIITGRIKLASPPSLRGLRSYAQHVEMLARRNGCAVLAGGSAVHPNPEPLDEMDLWETHNSALWFNPGAPTGEQAYGEYAKMHPVPFSEYVPFKRSCLWLHRTLRWFVPPVMDQLAPGDERTVFIVRRDGKACRLVSPICYEGVFARLCRGLVWQGGQKSADVIVNLSNDGWFVYKWGGRWRASTEQRQHMVQSCFRAVENRVPVVRAVNTGVSCSIDSNGRVLAYVGQEMRQWTMVPGTLLLDEAMKNDTEFLNGHGPLVLVDSRVTVYSRVGDAFAVAVSLAGAVMTVYLLCCRWSVSRKRKGAMDARKKVGGSDGGGGGAGPDRMQHGRRGARGRSGQGVRGRAGGASKRSR